MEERVTVDLATGRRIRRPGPGVDDQLSVQVGGDLEPGFSPVADQLIEHSVDPLLCVHLDSLPNGWPGLVSSTS